MYKIFLHFLIQMTFKIFKSKNESVPFYDAFFVSLIRKFYMKTFQKITLFNSYQFAHLLLIFCKSNLALLTLNSFFV